MILNPSIVSPWAQERELERMIKQHGVDIQRLWIRVPDAPDGFRGQTIAYPAGQATPTPP